MSHKKAPPGPETLSRLGSMTDLMSLRSFGGPTLIDHRHARLKHKKVIDALNVQTRQGIPIQRSLAKLQAEGQKILENHIRLTDDEVKIFVAALAECQLRICLEAELGIAGEAYWFALHWQDRIASPFATWVEDGPFTWFQDEDEALTPEDKLEHLQRLMNQVNVGTGLIQQHITRKIVNTELEYLSVWSKEALDLIDDILNDDFESPDRMTLRSASLMLSAQGSVDPQQQTLKECMQRLGKLREKIAVRAGRFETLTEPLRPPSFWRRRWLVGLIAAPFFLFSMRWIYGRRAEIPRWIAQAIESTREFFQEHVSEPSMAIAKELIWNEHENITDVAALEDAKQSLARMLEAFIKDTDPKLPEAERKALAESMDMSVVSSQYEQSLPQAIKHMMSGEIVRMLLIQVQFIKKELLVAMQAIDGVMNSNNLNFRLMAIFPAVLAVYGAYQGSKSITYKLTRRKGRRETIMLLRSFLLSMERMLNLRNVGASEDEIKYLKMDRAQLIKPVLSSHPPPGPPVAPGMPMPPSHATRQTLTESGAGGSYTVYEDMEDILGDPHGNEGEPPLYQHDGPGMPPNVSAASTWGDLEASRGAGGYNPDLRVVFLKPEDLGVLLLLLHQFSAVIERTSKRFLTDLELRNLREDLNELSGNCGPVTVTQQLCVVQRMYRSYRFLQSPAGGLFSGL